MHLLGTVLLIAAMILLFAGWLLGMINFIRIFLEARRAGRSFWDLYWFGAYRYAFNEKKGSPETRWMVIGFGATIASILVFTLAAFILDTSRH